ncbi:MAG: sugar-binding protein [Armatimonadota bacterium]
MRGFPTNVFSPHAWLVPALMCCLPAFAATPAAERVPWNLQTFALYTATPPTIDGDLAEWDMTLGAIPINGENARKHGICDGPWKDDRDASARLALRWDGKFLYAAARVTDDHPIPVSRMIDYWEGNRPVDYPWAHDSWMLYFESIGQPASTGRFQPKRTCPVLTHPHIGLTLATKEAKNIFLPAGSDCATRIVEGGYILEAKIPWEALGYDVRCGDRLRLGHILVDADQNGEWSQIGAFFSDGQNPRSWGRLRLASENGAGADLVVGQDTLVAGQPLVLKCSGDALKGASEIRALVIIGPGSFRKTIPQHILLENGATTVIPFTLETKGWPAGAYDVTIEVGGAQAPHARFQVVTALKPLKPDNRGVSVTPASADPRANLPFRPKPAPQPDEVTKAAYLKFIREYGNGAKGLGKNYLNGSNTSPSLGIQGLYYASFDFAQDKKAEDAELAIALLKKMNERNSRYTAWDITKIHLATKWLANSPYAERMLAETKRAMRLFMPDYTHFTYTNLERGAMNRAMHVAGAAETVLHYVPDLPEADKWRAYIEQVWNDWYEQRDFAENSTNYDPIDFDVILEWIPLRPNSEKIWTDPGVKALFERYMLRTLPLGTIPTHGDALPWNTNWHGWVAPFEVAAARFQDGRFHWAAQRIFSYAVTHAENIWSWSYIGSMGADRLAAVYDQIDPKVQPVPLTDAVRVTYRHEIDVNQWNKRKPGQPDLFLKPGMMPDKAVFTSGTGKGDLAAFFELSEEAGHYLSTTPSLCGLVDHGAVLLHDLAYYEKTPDFHNMIYLEDQEGVPAAGRESTAVLAQAAGSRAAYGAFAVSNFQGFPVTDTREVLLAKNNCLLIKDTVKFTRGFRARLGQAYQLKEVGPAIGDHWVNSYIAIPYTRPLADYSLGRWYNNPRDLLIYYAPRADRWLELIDRKASLKIQQLPVRARYCWSGAPADGEEVCFTALLLPHDPSVAADTLARGITVLTDTPDVTIVRVIGADETSYLILNRAGTLVTADKLRTDARQALVTVKNGAVNSAWARQTTRLVFGGKTLHTSKTPRDVDTGGK